jgi:predicted amidophosphoribosyltransferase
MSDQTTPVVCDRCSRELETDEEHELGLCEKCQPKMERDAAWDSEERLRSMEGYGSYEGPVTWP